MKEYIDKSFLKNPLSIYLKWLSVKVYYQLKNWGKHLRVNYNCVISNSHFGKYNWLGNYSQIYNSKIDDFTYCSEYCVIANAEIGKFCSIGPNVKIAPGKHPSSGHISTHPTTFNTQRNLIKNFVTKNTYKNFDEVKIGNDVWIGANCIVVDGVTIADGAIIAANSVVNKNVGPYEIVGGVPAKLIKKRFSDDEIAVLLKTRWWDKGEEWIQDNITTFASVNDFLNEQIAE